jgi:hypothetical protein
MLKRPKQRKTPSEPNRKHFTDDNVLKLRPNKGRQYLVWDAGTGAARGLAILVSPTGTASYRSVFYFKGSPKPHWMNLGRVGEMTLESVRKHQAGLQSFRSMRRIEASRKNASALRLRFSQSLASLRQRLSHAMVRSTIHRFGSTINPLA